MASKSYRKGYRFEREVAEWFEKQGFFVIRQGKSRFPDLIAIPPITSYWTLPRLIECKYNKLPTKQEIRKLMELENKYTCNTLIAFKRKGERGFELLIPEELLEEEDEECPTS